MRKRKRISWNSVSKYVQTRTGHVWIALAATTLLALASTPTLAQSWIQLSPAGAPPSARTAHSAAYDPGTNQMIVFAGLAMPYHVNDVWRLSGANGVGAPAWTELFPTGPIPATRWIHDAVYDATSNRKIVFGGGLGYSSPCTNEVWVLSNANGLGGTPAWTQLFPTNPPADSYVMTPTASYDAASNRMIVFGGLRAVVVTHGNMKSKCGSMS